VGVIAYLLGWLLFCLVAVALYLREPAAYAFSHRAYWRFLAAPWKLGSFTLAALGLTLVAPYTGDPTWDYADALFMSLLTFLSAPWALGALYRGWRGRLPCRQLPVALALWGFSAGWSYDLYILLRDGYYPATWLPNLVLSSMLYAAGGLMWSLELTTEGRVRFAFTAGDWPAPPRAAGLRLWLAALPFVLGGLALVLPFLWHHLR